MVAPGYSDVMEWREHAKEDKAVIRKMRRRTCLPVIVMSFVAVSALLYTSTFVIKPFKLWENFELDLKVIAPYVEEGEIEQLRSEWVLMKYRSDYEVSSNGRVRRIKDGMILSQSSNVKNGAMRVYLDRKRYYVHRLVTEAFFDDDSDRVVRHRDGDKRNNSVLNLVKEIPDYSLQMDEDEGDLWP